MSLSLKLLKLTYPFATAPKHSISLKDTNIMMNSLNVTSSQLLELDFSFKHTQNSYFPVDYCVQCCVPLRLSKDMGGRFWYLLSQYTWIWLQIWLKSIKNVSTRIICTLYDLALQRRLWRSFFVLFTIKSTETTV